MFKKSKKAKKQLHIFNFSYIINKVEYFVEKRKIYYKKTIKSECIRHLKMYTTFKTYADIIILAKDGKG